MATSEAKKALGAVRAAIVARRTLIWITTDEERRAEESVLQVAVEQNYTPIRWDCATGATSADGRKITLGGGVDPITGQDTDTLPSAPIAEAMKLGGRKVWILRDIHQWTRDPTVTRGLKSAARALQETANVDRFGVIVIISPSSEIPPELSAAVVIRWPLPDRAELAAILETHVRMHAIKLAALAQEKGATEPEDTLREAARRSILNGSSDAIVEAAVGLTSDAAAGAYATSLVSTGSIDAIRVAEEKKRLLSGVPGLTLWDPDPAGLAAVGGLENLKAWLAKMALAFTSEAREYGLRAPRGVLLVGVSGCGKSLIAKAIAMAWALLLIRLDPGATKSKYVGESEANIRKALQVPEAIGRSILLIEEIDKALAGSTGQASDGGVSSDALGAILTWREETTAPVFLVATANRTADLPTELYRRFSAVFFVDVPHSGERRAIFAASIRKLGARVSDGAVRSTVIDATDGFTGAEICDVVDAAMFAAFADGARDVTAGDLLQAAAAVVPLSKTAAKEIEAQRSWAAGRARPASLPPESEPAAVDGRAMLDT